MKYSPKKFNIEYKARIKPFSADNDIRVWIAKPVTSVCQKIKSFSIFPNPKSYYKDKYKNEILYFKFKNLENITIQMNIKMVLWKDKVDLKKNIHLPNTYTRFLNLCTKDEKFLEQTPEIKKLTFQITKNDKSILDKLQSIFNFVTKNFKYCYPVKQRGVKHLNLKNLKGDCGEYSSLFVTMCRILKIPAKNNTGFVVFPKQKKTAEHGWVSVYLEPCGWVNMDTQYASLEKNIKMGIKKYFAQKNDYRITFTNGFNISLKPAIPQSFQLVYWNKLGLPLSNNSIQTLQPIMFASQKKIEFKDRIKLI